MKTSILVLTDSSFINRTHIYNGNVAVTIGKYVEYFPDSLEEWSIEDIASQKFYSKFLPIPLDSNGKLIDSLVPKSKVCWLRLQVINQSKTTGDWWFNCIRAKTTEIFFPIGNGFTVKKNRRDSNSRKGYKSCRLLYKSIYSCGYYNTLFPM